MKGRFQGCAMGRTVTELSVLEMRSLKLRRAGQEFPRVPPMSEAHGDNVLTQTGCVQRSGVHFSDKAGG